MEGQQFNITEGSNGSITCTAIGYPLPTVVWQNSDGSSLNNRTLVSGDAVANVTSVSIELMIVGALKADTGMYTCRTDTLNETANVTININVQGEFRFTCLCS